MGRAEAWTEGPQYPRSGLQGNIFESRSCCMLLICLHAACGQRAQVACASLAFGLTRLQSIECGGKHTLHATAALPQERMAAIRREQDEAAIKECSFRPQVGLRQGSVGR